MKSEEDVPDTPVSESCVTQNGSSTSHGPPPIIHHNVRMQPARNNLRTDAGMAEEGKLSVIYDNIHPNRNTHRFH